MNEQLVDTWHIHNRIVLYMLDAIAPDALATKPQRGRTAGETLAHIHNVRLMWLQSAAPALMDGLEKIDKERAADKTLLDAQLRASGEAVGTIVARTLEHGERVKGFKPHAAAFVGYLISHESHHRGQVVLQLQQAGAPLDKKVLFGLWEWGAR